MRIVNIIFFILMSLSIFSQVVYDYEGNSYNTVVIGSQVWMQENLKTSKYNNGENIIRIDSDQEWYSNFTIPAYTNYNNDANISLTYGRLYNWPALTDSRGVCPEGFRIPSDNDWQTMINYLGGAEIAGGKLKEAGFTHWSQPNTGATNSSNFTALPAGMRAAATGEFYHLGELAGWYSSTEYDQENAYIRTIFWDSQEIERGLGKFVGFSGRCMKDATSEKENNELNKQVSIYPNPASDYFIIEMFEVSNYNLKITDFNGLEIYKNQFKLSSTINTNHYSPGIYFIQIYQDNALIIIKKIEIIN